MFCVHKVLSRQLVQYEFGVNSCMFLELFLTFHCQDLEARLVLVCQRRFAKRLQATMTWMTGKNQKNVIQKYIIKGQKPSQLQNTNNK